jgi:23S rRNA (adenine2030-N6)-methyltransferase
VFSYQHDYHAGNHADVLKHIVLTLLIEALQRKPTPLRVIDTHAGSGTYDLASAMAQHGREFEQGVARVLDVVPTPPELARFVEAVKSLNEDGALRFYPGSPQMARMLLRPNDHLELFELHPQACNALTALFARDRQTHVHRRDAFEGLTAALPPPERRGIVLIDPSYETADEFGQVLAAMQRAHRRWPSGVYVVWFPLLAKAAGAKFIERLEALPLPRLFQVELEVAPGATGLRGSGLVIANLPFAVDAQLRTLLPWLHRHLAPHGAGGWRARWLRAE